MQCFPYGMAVTIPSSRALQSLPQLPSAAPRLVQSVVGGLLELMIHVVEDLRERRGAR